LPDSIHYGLAHLRRRPVLERLEHFYQA
jgi:hypothetical protein